MKKRPLMMLSSALFLGALVVSFSSNSKGNLGLVNKSQAFDTDRRTYTLICTNGDKITVCGLGVNTCFPVGQCGPQG